MTGEEIGIVAFLVFAGGVLLKIILKVRRGEYPPPHSRDFWSSCSGGGGGGCGAGCGGGG